MATQNQYSVTLTVDGRLCGIYDNMTGGEIDSEETKHRPGAMGEQESYGGPRMVGNVTITRVNKRDRDAQELFHWLADRVGRARCVVTKQPLDADRNAFGRAVVYRGVLKTVTPGDVNSNSQDADTYDIVVSTEGSIG